MFQHDYIFKYINLARLANHPHRDLCDRSMCFKDYTAEIMFDREVRYLHYSNSLQRIFTLSIPQLKLYKFLSITQRQELWSVFMVHVYSVLVGCLFDLHARVPIERNPLYYCIYADKLTYILNTSKSWR